jgi:hypothetical protein
LPSLSPASLVAAAITHVVAIAIAIALVADARPSPDVFTVSQPVSQHVAI